MRRPVCLIASGAMLGGLLVAGSVTTASASPDLTAAAVLDASQGINVTASADTNAVGVVQNPGVARFNEFPLRGGGNTYVALSTGKVSDLFDMSGTVGGDGFQPSTAIAGYDDESNDRYDISTLTINVPAQASGKCLVFEVAMGTEERATDGSAQPDSLTIMKRGEDTNYATVVNGAYASLAGASTAKVPYTVGQLENWTVVGSGAQSPALGTNDEPRIPAVSPFDYFTSPDNVEIPIQSGSGSTQVDVTISDAGQEWRDSIALVDRVRLTTYCSTDARANTGITTNGVVIKGNPGIGNELTVDLVNADRDDVFEQHDGTNNGWFPAGSVDVHFRWYVASRVGDGYCGPDDSWVPIPGADRQTFVPTESMKNHCVVVRVTGKKDGYVTQTFPARTEAEWQTPLLVGNGVFTKASAPKITAPATLEVGDVLAVPNPSWKPTPASYDYQWFRQSMVGASNYVPIPGATGSSYRLTSAETGLSVRVRVMANRYNFTNRSMDSDSTARVQYATYVHSVSPVLDRVVVLAGETTTAIARETSWEPLPEKVSYQWFVDGKTKLGATSSSFTPTSSDVGKTLEVAVTYTLGGYAPETRRTGKVKIGGMPMVGGRIALAGTARVGTELIASVVDWNPGDAKFTYEWWLGSSKLQSGSRPRFTIPPSAYGKQVTVKVVATRNGYDRKVVHNHSPRVAAGTLVSAVPRVAGSARPGKTLSAFVSWGPRPVTYRYQWYVGSKAIKRATKSSYKVSKKYRNKKIRVRVVGLKPGYATVARYSSFKRVAKR